MSRITKYILGIVIGCIYFLLFLLVRKHYGFEITVLFGITQIIVHMAMYSFDYYFKK